MNERKVSLVGSHFCSLKLWQHQTVVDPKYAPFLLTGLTASKVMLLLLSLLPLVHGGKFMEIQGVSAAPGTSFGDSLTGNAASCQDACDKEMTCDCALFDPLHGSCKMQADCLYFHPDYEGGGTLELYIKLPPHLWPFSVFPGTNANRDGQDVTADKKGMTEQDCVDLCYQSSDCQCAVLLTKDRRSSADPADDHCWLQSKCHPEGFKQMKGAQDYITFVKDANFAAYQTGSGSLVMLIVCLVVVLLMCVVVTALVLYYMRNKGRAYRAILQDLAVPKEENSRKEYAKEQLLSSFSRKSGVGYLSSLELALEAKVSNSDIPCVYSLHKVPETFKVPQIDTSVTSLKVQLCFVLDYTGSMKTQIAQAKDSVSKIIEAMQKMKIASLPNAAVDVEMAAVAYFDWDAETRKLGRPVVSVFGGREVKEEHSDTLTAEKFCQLGGTWTKDTSALQKWINQGLGHGGKVPEELTGALLAAANLEWNADEKLMVVITDAPCHGKDYSTVEHDSFCDKSTGLTCTGRPEEPLQSLMAQGVTTVILHTGEAAAVSMCQKLQQTDPKLIHEKVSPSETAKKVVSVLESKVRNGQN
ncbi:unnamed protein product [Cladocopium goreaui]|uniref:Mitogen-activated protein kinase kinase kinase 2 n=1 Tax=Cladocopium goreaui TaxID=2562237 RepID=A0A9P1DR10_9DINO|nr:unnamed protein product [Cladocopium goreaui]